MEALETLLQKAVEPGFKLNPRTRRGLLRLLPVMERQWVKLIEIYVLERTAAAFERMNNVRRRIETARLILGVGE